MAPPGTLAYDGSLNREGIAIDQSDGYFRLVTPRLRDWRSLGRVWIGAIITLGFFTLFPLLAALMSPASERAGPLVAAIEYGAILAVVIAFAVIRLQQQFILEITRDTFSLTRVDGRSRRTWIYRRDAITNIHAGSIKGVLIIHVRGKDMIELPLSRDARVSEQASDALNAAIKRDMSPLDRTLPVGLISQPSISSTMRKLLVATSIGTAIIGTLAGMHWQFPPIAVFAFIAALAPLGIAFGTQEKEYYMF